MYRAVPLSRTSLILMVTTALSSLTSAIMSRKNVVLVTGAAGWLGSLVAQALFEDSAFPDPHLILADISEPRRPKGSKALTIQADLTNPPEVDALFKTEFGIPDTVYCMHGIMSRGSEDNFDFGLKVNVDSVRELLQATRRYGELEERDRPIKFIFTSSLAVYGGPLPEIIKPDTIASPEGAYGLAKLASELFINEFSRRGFVDGRVLRLPTIIVRPGPPAAAASSFMSGIIREPLQGAEAVCPIGTSIASPELDLPIWVASPQTTVRNLVLARHVDAGKFPKHTRVVCAPGFTATVREEIEALRKVAGEGALRLIRFEDDLPTRRLVSSWPSRFDNAYALSLGFIVDEGGMVPIVEQFQQNLIAQ